METTTAKPSTTQLTNKELLLTLMKRYRIQNQNKLAAALGVSPSYISRLACLLRKPKHKRPKPEVKVEILVIL